jgi:hypothetical protein
MRSLLRGAAVLALALGAVAPAWALGGLAFVDESGDQTLIAGGRVKISPTSPDAPAFMLDMTRARVWVANPGQRTVWEGTVDEYCASVKGLAEGARGAAGPIRVTVEPTDQTDTIAGWPTRKYRILADGVLHEELWLTADASVARELASGRVSETFGRMMGCMLGAQPGAGVESSAEYRQLYARGWPLRSVYYGRGGASGTSTVIKAERRDIAEREFAIPAGYRPAPFAEVFGGGPR